MFTIENEVDGKLPYLDLLLNKQENGTIKIDWYQKPTASNRILNFLSQHPLQQKESVAYGFFHRILTLVDDEFADKCTTKIINILKENGYPWKIINKQLQRFKSPNLREEKTFIFSLCKR